MEGEEGWDMAKAMIFELTVVLIEEGLGGSASAKIRRAPGWNPVVGWTKSKGVHQGAARALGRWGKGRREKLEADGDRWLLKAVQ
jgi:hypothetical protein